MVEDNILVNGNNYSWINWIKDNSGWTTTKRKQAKKIVIISTTTEIRRELPSRTNMGLVSNETVVLCRWGSEAQNFRFINWVDKVNWLPTDS